MSIERKRLSPEESRAAALEAASAILMEAGPQAVTLKAVAARMGRTHANLLHHFGSAAGLQMALAAHLAGTVCDSIADILLENGGAEHDPARVVNMVFDAFDKQGAGQLATWMILSGNENAMNPVVDAIHELIDEIGNGHENTSMHEDTLTLVLMAMGDALLGEPLARSLGLPRDAARDIATRLLADSPRLAEDSPAK
ncbi:MAG: TetR/AcrR family transcriptional regulator [Sphingomonadaceae bacterium]|jgi:AcrR family transcriptional regulator|nr:TetR/AcrR family transcriptional regulator [Sphingomonadaceae bacterium]NCA00594.1 TetR/AcrR family transcriptional regulator [Sphingomonadaceae bacterium]